MEPEMPTCDQCGDPVALQHGRKPSGEETVRTVCSRCDGPSLADILRSTPIIDMQTMVNQATAQAPSDERPFRISLRDLTNAHLFERGDRATAIVMVYHPPTHEWVGVSPKDAMSEMPLPDCRSYARFSQDRVERMMQDRRLARDVLGVAAMKGVAIIDWVKREDLR